ncbi:MarR family winged helix-turn-helix transcriptional regulator [Microbacterium sp.]|uniref:MarR family winged helix-turn-helix transcriptional regulator n=1 Tax=Microbacterium sp. TaxID=51671 RepID=UPI0039E2A93A
MSAEPDAARRDPTRLDPTRLWAAISPLRRTLLATTLAEEELPDLPEAQIEVIRALPRGTVASPSELAAALGLSRPSVSNLLAAMERTGLAARRPHERDGRQVDVVASERALAYFERFDAANAALVDGLAAELTPGEVAAIDRALPALERLRDLLVAHRRTGGTPVAGARSAASAAPATSAASAASVEEPA